MENGIRVIAQGGGIMTSYHAGVIRAIKEQYGLGRITHIYGISGGAATWTYAASGQTEFIEPLWTELITCGRFIRPFHHPTGSGVMNVDVLVDEMIRRKFPLDLKALRTSPICMEVCATHAQTANPSWFTQHDSSDFLEVLRATCAVPYFYGRPVYINNQPYYDGGIASTTGTEHVDLTGKTLVALTRPQSEIGLPMPLRRFLRWLLIRKESIHLQEAIFSAPERRAHEMRRLNTLEKLLSSKRLCILRPQRDLPTLRIDPRVHALKATIQRGYTDTIQSKTLSAFMNG